MLARGIRSYHRPASLAEALDLARRGATPLAGGTRLLAAAIEVPNVLDLSALDLARAERDDGDLVLGPLTTLQDVLESPFAGPDTAGLLPEACRAHSASPVVRNMATLGGEAIHGAPDSEVVAALLALNAVFVVHQAEAGALETPALRFLKRPAEDLGNGGILVSIVIPGAPDGTALERVAAAPSEPAIVAVAASLAFAGEQCARARIVLTGLRGRPARILEAESRLEGTRADASALERCVAQIVERAEFADDARASATYRRETARVLALRALRRAAQAAGAGPAGEPARPRRRAGAGGPVSALPYFTSGRIETTINGQPRSAAIEARTTLLELLRGEGLTGARPSCEAGDCGACAVLLDGRPVAACLTLALRAQGRSLLTAEGLAATGLHRAQAALLDAEGLGCGYCTPARALLLRALLEREREPGAEAVREALAGVACGCSAPASALAARLGRSSA